MTRKNRHVLLLQGPSSLFFAHLGRAFLARDVEVTRVGFCPGDRLYWRKSSGDYVAYRGRAADWASFCRDLIAERGVTDLVMLGDGRALHKDAVGVAGGAVPWIVEQGYLRPDLLTIEPWGTGGRSRVKRAFVRGAKTGEAPPSFASSFARYAVMDTGYHLANMLSSWALYPQYRNHAIFPQHQEWAGWIGKGLRAKRRRATAKAVMADLMQGAEIFVFPLQLETDYQIRDFAPAGGVRAALERVIAAFASFAPPEARLVVKTHPMDNGLTPWVQLTVAAATASSVSERVVFLDGGNLDPLLARAMGCVTINSTVGLTAAQLGCPVAVLGEAIYDIDGITAPVDLGAFFADPVAPDEHVVADFVAHLKASVLVPGAFDGSGVEPGAANVADKVLAGPVFEQGAM